MRLLIVLIALLLGVSTLSAQDEFTQRRQEMLVEIGQRHLELGVWCRDRGLTSQATAEFLAAVEESEHRHPTAGRLVGIMRGLGEKFWKKRKRPAPSSFKAFAKKYTKLQEKDLEDRLGLAEYAWKKKMRERAKEEFEILLRKQDAALISDDKERLKVAGGTIPVELSEQFRKEAVRINGDLYLRDAFLERIPDIEEIQQVEDDALRIRGVLDKEHAEDLFLLTKALLPHLEERLLARPGVKLQVFVFAKTEHYDAYLESIERPALKAVSGFAQKDGWTAVVNAEGLSPADLHGLILHEVTHLYMFAVSRAVMPSWYSEGLAESFGGQGTYSWSGSALEIGGEMAGFRTDALLDKTKRLPLEELLTADALALFAEDREKALAFYVQAWTLERYLRNEADKPWREKFERWEQQCFGAALGAELDNGWASDASASEALFRELFGEEIKEMGKEYERWLTGWLAP